MTCICTIQTTRERLRLTQAELARRAGLSRQVVNMVERGKILPSVATALALAEALECEVTDIFQKPRMQRMLQVKIAPSVSYEQGQVRLGQVGSRWIAYPGIAAEDTGFGEADGQLVSREGSEGVVRPLRTESQLASNLLLVGADPALGLVRDLWRRNHIEGCVRWQNLSCAASLQALVRGEAHVAGICYPDGAMERRALAAMPHEVAVVRFTRWELGWMVRTGNPVGIRTGRDLLKPGVRFLNQAEGSIGRQMVDFLLGKEGLPEPPSVIPAGRSPFECAEAISAGQADVAMGQRAVAGSFRLEFIPVKEVAFDLVISRDLLGTHPVSRLLDLLQSKDFHSQLAGLPGYSTAETGMRISFSKAKEMDIFFE